MGVTLYSYSRPQPIVKMLAPVSSQTDQAVRWVFNSYWLHFQTAFLCLLPGFYTYVRGTHYKHKPTFYMENVLQPHKSFLKTNQKKIHFFLASCHYFVYPQLVCAGGGSALSCRLLVLPLVSAVGRRLLTFEKQRSCVWPSLSTSFLGFSNAEKQEYTTAGKTFISCSVSRKCRTLSTNEFHEKPSSFHFFFNDISSYWKSLSLFGGTGRVSERSLTECIWSPTSRIKRLDCHIHGRSK